jgi:dipeptidyl aminopeptidase/acylaminoacyl peptidase
MRCSDIFGFSQITHAVISPAGDAVAFTRRTADRESDRYGWELLVTTIPGGARPVVTVSLGADLRSPAWAPDGRRLAAIEHRPGDAPSSIVIITAADGARRRLDTNGSKLASPAWSPDGREVGFLGLSPLGEPGTRERCSARAGAPTVVSNLSAKIDGLGIAGSWRRHLFVADATTGAVRQLTDGDLWIEDFCYSPAGLIAACGGGPGSARLPRQPGAVRPSALWLVDRSSGARRELAPASAGARCPAFVSDHLVFVGLAELRADLPRLFAVPVAGGPVRQLGGMLDRGVVTGTATFTGGHPPVAGRRDEVLFCARDGGCVQLYETTLGSPGVTRVTGTEQESVGAVSTGQAGNLIGYVCSLAGGGQQLTMLDRQSGRRTVLAQVNPPGPAWPAEPAEFTARDGRRLHGWVIRGRSRGRAPLLLDVHGGSFSGAWSPVVQPSRLYQQELAEAGWTVLLLNARGSDGYGSDFARAAIGAWGTADAPDFHDAIDALIGQGLIDPDSLAVTGYSYGGFMSNWLTATSDRFSAAVAGGSICDFVSLFGTSDMGWTMSEYDIGVRPDVDPVQALRRSPVGLGRQVRTPTLLLHGEADHRCPISQAEEWLALLYGSGCEATLVRYPGASHGFLTHGAPSVVADYGNRVVDWVVSHAPSSSARTASVPKGRQ